MGFKIKEDGRSVVQGFLMAKLAYPRMEVLLLTVPQDQQYLMLSLLEGILEPLATMCTFRS